MLETGMMKGVPKAVLDRATAAAGGLRHSLVTDLYAQEQEDSFSLLSLTVARVLLFVPLSFVFFFPSFLPSFLPLFIY